MLHKNISLHYQDHTDGVKNSFDLIKKCGNHLDKYKIFDKSINHNFECHNHNNNILPNSENEREQFDANSSMFSNSIQRNGYTFLESELYTFASDIETTFSEKNYKTYNNKITSNSTSKHLVKSKGEAKNTSKSIHVSPLTLKEKLYSDKTTYCRPVLNFYNQQFMYKTMQKNTQLKHLVRKLDLERQQEKDNVTWNNYINELKNKHGLYLNDSKTNILPQQHHGYYTYPEMIDDYYNTKFTWTRSVPCRNLLDDMYGIYSAYQPTCTTNSRRRNYDKNHSPYDHSSFCYPTCSQGRLTVLEREKQFNEYANGCNKYRNVNKTTALTENGGQTKTCFKGNSPSQFKSSLVQTDIPVLEKNEFKHELNCKSMRVKEEICKISEIATTQGTKNKDDSNTRPKSLTNIEKKLEALIESVNKLIGGIQQKNTLNLENKCISCKIETKINKKPRVKENNLQDISKTHSIIGNIISESSGSTLAVAEVISQFNQILPCIKNKSEIYFDYTNNSVDNKYIEQYFKKQLNQQCSVQIPFEVPTRDCYTEVTKSLSKQVFSTGDKKEIVDNLKSLESPVASPCMTIAVNTDPLSLLSLLRISADTIRQLLSYMPTINYNAYLSMLHFPYLIRNSQSYYVCNICGANFAKPSELSDHIQGHNLPKSKDCCVCRHILDVTRRARGLFNCQYCGQRFTRAYCCELHQQTCARRLGLKHDVTSSLMILR